MPKTARVLIINNNQVLLMFRYNHGDVYFTIPGGRQEDNESLEETAKRELLEETNINADIVKHLSASQHEEYNIQHHLYLGIYISGDVELNSANELERMNEEPDDFFKPMWVNLHAALNIPIYPPQVENFVKDYIRGLL